MEMGGYFHVFYHRSSEDIKENDSIEAT